MGCACKNSIFNVKGGRKSYSRKTKQKRSSQSKTKKRLFSNKRRSKSGKSMKKIRGGSLNLIGVNPVSDVANLTSKLTGYPYMNSSTLHSTSYSSPNSYVV